MKSKTIELDEQKLTIEKLPLGKYAQLLRALKELPKSISNLDGVSNEYILQQLPELVATSLPEVVNILTIATPLTAEEIENLALDEVVKVILAVIEVNQYKQVFEEVKKVMTSPKQTQE